MGLLAFDGIQLEYNNNSVQSRRKMAQHDITGAPSCAGRKSVSFCESVSTVRAQKVRGPAVPAVRTGFIDFL